MRIKNTLLLFLFCSLFLRAFSQEKILQIPYYNDSDRNVHHVFNESDSSFALSFFSAENIVHYLIRNNSVQAKFSKPNDLPGLPGSKYLGGNLEGDSLEEYYLDKSYKYIITLFTDLSTGTTTISDTVTLVRKERFVTAFLQGHQFYFVSYINNSNIVRIYQKPFGAIPTASEADIQFGKKDFNGEYYETDKGKLSYLSDLFKAPYAVILAGKDYHLALTSPLYKIYILKDQLLITTDNQCRRTLTIEINLKDLSYRVKKFDQPGSDVNEMIDRLGSSTNSYVLDSLLIQGAIINGTFNLSFTNWQTGTVYKSYSAKDQEELDIMNTAIIRVRDDKKVYGKSDSSVISFKDLIKKIKLNQIALSAVYQNDALKLTIGSLCVNNEINPGLMMLSVALGGLGSFALNTLPHALDFAVFSFWMHEASRTVSFQSLFDKSTYSHVGGQIENDEERSAIIRFILKNNIGEQHSFLTQSEGHYYLGYYTKEENNYTVYMF
jgi:hypothetical protein